MSQIPANTHEELRTDRDVLEEILETVLRTGIRDLNQGLGRLLTNPDVRHVELATKVVGGEQTTQPALKIIVAQKKPLRDLHPDEVIPSSIFGMPTDVVEESTDG